jgi:hypothetical protein
MTDRVLSGFRIVEILQDDTMQAIAARELNDASRWPDLVNINGLVPPYLTGDSSQAGPTVKLFGQSILVPAATTQVTAVSDPDRLFGVDLDLAGGRLTAVDGDFALVAGVANLKQALTHRIATGLKELLYHLPYGCDVRRVLGSANGPAAALLAGQYVKSALLLDPRVDSVTSTVVDVRGDVIAIVAKVQPVTGAAFDISAEI